MTVSDIWLATAADERYGFHLLNLIGSVQVNSDIFSRIVAFDLGLSRHQRALLDEVRGVEIAEVPPFVPHWRICRTWKPWIWTHLDAPALVWLDAGITVLRPLADPVRQIEERGYFAVSQGHPNRSSTPTDYIPEYALTDAQLDQVSIAAGIFGFRRGHDFYEQVVEPTFRDVVAGRNLGFSAGEVSKLNYGLDEHPDPIVRDCPLFRHEQTMLNIHFAKAIEDPVINDVYKYGGWMSPNDHPDQLIWSHRRRGDYRYLHRARYAPRGRLRATSATVSLRAAIWRRSNARFFQPAAYLRKARDLAKRSR